jgi:D-hydroxyproline dehydrogenase subunit beta
MRVVVVGAGIVGTDCARVLGCAGFDVTVLERGAAAGGTSSSCDGNLLVSDKTPGPELDLALLASSRWPQVAAELDDQLGTTFPSIEFEPKGGLVVAYGTTAADALLTFADTQRQAGVEAHTTTPQEALRLEPHLNPRIAVAVHGIGLSVGSAEILLVQLSHATAPLDPAPFALDRASLAPYLQEAA